MMRTLKMVAVASAMAISLAACSVVDTNAKRIQTACLTAATAVEGLTPLKPKMSVEQITQVNTVLDTIITPICGAKDQPEYSDLVLGRLTDAIGIFKEVSDGRK